jgi:hypothetical protein
MTAADEGSRSNCLIPYGQDRGINWMGNWMNPEPVQAKRWRHRWSTYRVSNKGRLFRSQPFYYQNYFEVWYCKKQQKDNAVGKETFIEEDSIINSNDLFNSWINIFRALFAGCFKMKC